MQAYFHVFSLLHLDPGTVEETMGPCTLVSRTMATSRSGESFNRFQQTPEKNPCQFQLLSTDRVAQQHSTQKCNDGVVQKRDYYEISFVIFLYLSALYIGSCYGLSRSPGHATISESFDRSPDSGCRRPRPPLSLALPL